MATIDFPDYLPRPGRVNYDINHVSPFERTEMRTGRARQRRTFQSVPSLVQVEWYLSNPEAQLFEGFFKWDITDGADWFNIDLKTPIGNIAPYECRFTDMYRGPRLDGADRWTYTAELEIRERPVLDEDTYRFGAEFILGASIIDKALNSLWPES